MKVVFYFDQRSLNDATLKYINLIEKSFKEIGIGMFYCNELKGVSKGDVLLTITAKYFFIAKLRHPFHKTIFWAQGVSPEEYSLEKGKNVFKYFLKNLFEYFAINYSNILFLVSNKMLQHFKVKYNFKSYNNLIIPCYNLNYIPGLAIATKERYLHPKFVYAGNLSSWQCVEEILQIFKYVKQNISDASLTLLVKDREAVSLLIDKYELEGIEINYVKLEDLQSELKKYKYGFLIREDNIVNNVATPTKMNSYLASAIIPIYTNAVDSFVENINLGDYTLSLDSKISIEKKGNEIVEFEKKEINSEVLDTNIQILFNEYYNDAFYESRIVQMLKKCFL